MAVVRRLARTVAVAAGRGQQRRRLGSSAIRVGRTAELETALDGTDQFAAVEGRAVLEVSGADATEFLQGMQCNDMAHIALGGSGMVTGFLAPQGRMVADAFVYPRNVGLNFPHPRYLVEVDARAKARMMQILGFYRLRARVDIRDATDEYVVWSVWGPRSAALVGGERVLGHVPRGALVLRDGVPTVGDVWMADGRAPGMGLRLLVDRSDGSLRLPEGFEQRSTAEYRLRRILKGVAEGADDFVAGVAVPLECNMDYMHGVHFGKGCYVGQELTIRTHHRGVVRKRIVPVLLTTTGGPGVDGTRNPLCVDRSWALDMPPQVEIARAAVASAAAGGAEPGVRTRRVPPGRLGSTAGNAALALMRLELVEQYVAQQGGSGGGGIAFEAASADGQRVFVSPWSPSWWPVGTL
ncbi:ccr4 associated factor [Coemansia spiralis]|nr:ccr4 associated factor [Coemansia spiralis]